MNKKIISYILLALIICHSIVDVYAITIPSNENSPKASPSVNNMQFIKINETVEIDKEITMTLYLDNIPYDNFTFKLYSNNSLEDVNAKDIDLKNFNNEEISFDYCINCSNLKTISLNYKLPKTVEIGNQITFNVQLINKDNEEEKMNYRGTVTVIDSVKKVEEDKEKEIDEKELNAKEKAEQEKNMNRKNSFSGNISFSSNKTSSSVGSNSSTTYKGSSNNYLSNITVKGYQLNKSFIKERLTYFVTVPNNVKSLNISTSKESSKASVNISGNSNFSVGVNKVLITVTAEDGRIKNYRVFVTRLESDTNEE